jgi:NAD(P)-dependent dehydrogenase (short-subunit alcohol dehydrogenase family)
MNVLIQKSSNVPYSVVLISGGTSGIGLSLVRLFRKLGLIVATFGRSIDHVLKLKQEYKHDPLIYIGHIDITNFDEVKKYYLHVKTLFGKIDILINNAAVSGPFCPISEISPYEITRTIDINLTAQIHFTSIIINDMPNSGVIINISSNACMGNSGGAIYSATKAGINAFTTSISKETDINIFAFNPGHVDTRMQYLARSADNKKFPIAEKLDELYIKGCLINPDDVAIYIAYLSLFPKKFISGSFIQYNEILLTIENDKHSKL